MKKSIEIALSHLARIAVDFVTSDPKDPKSHGNIYIELLKSLVGRSQFTFAALIFNLLCDQKAFIPARANKHYRLIGENIKSSLIELLGTDGVLVMPTCSTNAWRHYEYVRNLSSLTYVIIFNALGLPCTHVPTGFSSDGMPVGVQVVAAPHQDRLCLAMAKHLEDVFGGWTPPQ